MVRSLLMIADKYGLDIAQLALIGFGFWKIASNHLKHLASDVKNLINRVEKIDLDVVNVKERVSKIEGKLE